MSEEEQSKKNAKQLYKTVKSILEYLMDEGYINSYHINGEVVKESD